jgi:hypothetical protein
MASKTKSKGLGDTVARFTHFFRLDRFASWFAKKVLHLEDCGCDRRQDRLNKLFPYKKNKVYDTKDLFTSEYFGESERNDLPHTEA